jgi:hypothetical protein
MFTLLLVANGTFLVAAAIEERESDELGCLREDMGEFFLLLGFLEEDLCRKGKFRASC